MSRRSRRMLGALYAFRRARPTSRADGPGYLYAYIDNEHLFKIGMTKDFVRRKAEWDRRCPSSNRKWMPPIPVARRRRAESLAHLLLELWCTSRPRTYCLHCRKTHVEIFVFSSESSVAWEEIVYPLLIRAARE
ncbi:hypothetical protein F5880DRAFT_1511734 [Lentinula raphanica]|nr:hypothetical protein F5880DRAFT_1511734 [Lentinula raphanica]